MVMWLIATPASAVDLFIMHFKTPEPLQLDAGRVALLRTADAATPAAALSKAGLSADMQSLSIKGWFTAPIIQQARGAAAGVNDVATAVRTAATARGVRFASPVFVGDNGGPVIVTPTILMQFAATVSGDRARTIIADAGVGVIEASNWGHMPNTYKISCSLPDGFAVLAAANALALRDDVLFAEPDMLFTGSNEIVIPNDPFWPQLWGLHNTGHSGGIADMDMDIPEAWDITQGSASVAVLVIDTGVDINHPDLNLLPGVDTTGQGAVGEPVNQCDNHGTWVAGCISAIANNGLGVAGAAPLSPTVSARTFVSDTPTCTGLWTTQASWTVDSLDWGFQHGVRVTNNSNRYGFMSSAIEAKYAQTRAAGMIHFASAGNKALPMPTYPASLPDVNAVSALTRTGALASFSNRGAFISAPGESIVTTDRIGVDGGNTTDFALVHGTSFASPYTAAVAALMLAADPSLSSDDIFNILITTARDLGPIGFDSTFGAGFVNANDALRAPPPTRKCMFDTIKDGKVDIFDLMNMLNQWGAPYGPADLLGLLSEFGQCSG